MKSVIVGAGTYGEVYLDYLQSSGVDIVGFIDDDPFKKGLTVGGVTVLGDKDYLIANKDELNIEAVYCPIGNNKVRVELLSLFRSKGLLTPNYIHPSVNISDRVTIGQGVYILLGTNIMPYTVIEDFVMISMGVNLAHHCLLKKGTFLSTGCNFGASIIAEEKTYCGIGTTIMTGISSLGYNCLIGAGSVVIKDIPDNAVVVGNPARIIKYKGID